jgi:hypothetical protein
VLACGSGEDEYAGLGRYKLGTSTLKDAMGGRCDPTKLDDGRQATWCYALPPYKVGKHAANVDLYFLGTGDDAPLIEILLSIRGCDEDELVGWMRTNFGQQVDQRPKRAYWQNRYLWAAAFVPSEPGRCVVHFLPTSETSEIARLKGL